MSSTTTENLSTRVLKQQKLFSSHLSRHLREHGGRKAISHNLQSFWIIFAQQWMPKHQYSLKTLFTHFSCVHVKWRMKKFWTRRKIPPNEIANAYRFSAARCTASQGLVAVDNHKFHSAEQYSSIYSIGQNISRPTIKIFYCTRTWSLCQWLPPLLLCSKADNRWHNKCNKSTQSVYLSPFSHNRQCAKMISVFDEASPEPNIEFYEKVLDGVPSIVCTRSTD